MEGESFLGRFARCEVRDGQPRGSLDGKAVSGEARDSHMKRLKTGVAVNESSRPSGRAGVVRCKVSIMAISGDEDGFHTGPVGEVGCTFKEAK
jgi:hypothetical protein